MRKFGLIGFPLGHSFSQKFFSEKFQRELITDCVYENYPLPSITELPMLIASQPDLVGLNVTIPYKEQVIPYLNKSNEVVAETGACNCIQIREGKLAGYNTDVIGFERSLEKKLLDSHTHALILGKGGAAKAVAYVLKKKGIDYTFVTRHPALNSPEIPYTQVDTSWVQKCTLIINTTPLGMFPHTEECPDIPYAAVGSGHYLFDLIYNPSITLFLQKGQEQGAAVTNGHEMLLIQAEESWKIWNEK